MVAGLFASVDPWDSVPHRYRPTGRGQAAPRVMSPEERKIREDIGLANLGAMLGRRG